MVLSWEDLTTWDRQTFYFPNQTTESMFTENLHTLPSLTPSQLLLGVSCLCFNDFKPKKGFLAAKPRKLSVMSLMAIPRTHMGSGNSMGTWEEGSEKGGQRFLLRLWMYFPAHQPRVTDFFSLRCRIQKKGANSCECVFVASEARSCQGLWFGCRSIFSSIVSA